MAQGAQYRNGRAFEYALAEQYAAYLQEIGVTLDVIRNADHENAKACYDDSPFAERRRFDYCAALTIDTIVRLEPGLTAVGQPDKPLEIFINNDSAGEEGDVRDVVFQRPAHKWQIGFSAKNNNDAVKHSRLSRVLDFGMSWLGIPCSQRYWDEVKPIFDYLGQNIGKSWEDLGDAKSHEVYAPLLSAFRGELMRIYEANDGIPQKLIRYLLGNYAFYKIIKDDAHNFVVVKAFNLEGELNKPLDGAKPRYRTPKLSLPTRIIEFRMKDGSDNTLVMVMDGGWELSFRIHNASKMIEQSLKFDIKLLGTPPIIFTQYIFQDNEID